jgi:putative ABC transport system ATP-binding protein
MLEIRNISLKFGDTQLFKDLSFSVDCGQVVCITGDSGTGKTTLLRAILGFLPLDEGVISIDGEIINSMSAETFRRRMMYVPQELSLPFDTVEEMVQLPFTLKYNRSVKFSYDKMMEEWKKLDLDSSLYKSSVAKVSGGQRQRMMIAVCGLLQKPILLTDEPTSALDETCVGHVIKYFRELASKGTIVIAVSHDKTFSSLCDKIICLNNGNN